MKEMGRHPRLYEFRTRIHLIDKLSCPHVFLTKDESDKRRLKLQDFIAMATDRQDLSPYVPVIIDYYNYRNKELDGYIYYDGLNQLVALVMQDKEPGQPFELLLNAEVTSPSPEFPNGVKAFEFFISKISEVIQNEA